MKTTRAKAFNKALAVVKREIGKPLYDMLVKRSINIISISILILLVLLMVLVLSSSFNCIRNEEKTGDESKIGIRGEGSLPGELADYIIKSLGSDFKEEGEVSETGADPGSNETEAYNQIIKIEIVPRDVKKGETPKYVGISENQQERVNYAEIADHILSKASLLVTVFSVFVIVITLIVAIMGVKWLREYSELKKNVKDASDTSLQSLATIGLSIPPLKYTSIIPMAYEPTLRVIHEHMKVGAKRDAALDNQDLGGLLLLESLYLSLYGDFPGARDLLFDLNKNWWYDEKLKGEIRFRLAVEYVQTGKYDKAEKVEPEGWEHLFKMILKVRGFEGTEAITGLEGIFQEYLIKVTSVKEGEKGLIIKGIEELGEYPASRGHQIMYLLRRKPKEKKIRDALFDNLETSINHVINNHQTSPNVLAAWYYTLAGIYHRKSGGNSPDDNKIAEKYINLARMAMKEAQSGGISQFYSGYAVKNLKYNDFENELERFEGNLIEHGKQKK